MSPVALDDGWSLVEEPSTTWAEFHKQLDLDVRGTWTSVLGLHVAEKPPVEVPSRTSIIWLWSDDRSTLWRLRLDPQIGGSCRVNGAKLVRSLSEVKRDESITVRSLVGRLWEGSRVTPRLASGSESLAAYQWHILEVQDVMPMTFLLPMSSHAHG